MLPKVVILDRIELPDIETEVLSGVADVEAWNIEKAQHKRFDFGTIDIAIVWNFIDIRSHTLEQMKSCRLIVRAGVGYDNIDIDAAGRLGIPVVTIPDYGTNDVADHTIALLLASARGLLRYDHALRTDIKDGWQPNAGGPLRRLTGRTLGIVGFGRIGAAVAHRARSFGLNIAFYDPFIPPGVEKAWQVERVASLPTLARESDFLSLHVPANSTTIGLINEDIIRCLPRGATIINTARGELVDLDAIERALMDGHLAALAADVLPEEPPRRNSLLEARYNSPTLEWVGKLVLTPHAAIHSTECMRELRSKSAEAARSYLDNGNLYHCINEHSLKRLAS